ncbi:unnamed protein product [Phytophthora fragariaefolia]|uniref:Unnamed protein product n=1 Tax=Phytophthora fragariaefolia TaxID=1490495 RepID=A0A9W6YF58_9STRA|nr:unnamed protein product [Phytophthora fragariaefolia]
MNGDHTACGPPEYQVEERNALCKRALRERHHSDKVSSSDSEDDKKHKNLKIGSLDTPVNWNGDDWTFYMYKHAMLNAFEKSLLDEIATGKATEDVTWDQDKKDTFKKKHAKIKILIQGSLQEEPGHDGAEGVSPAERATQDSSACEWRREEPPLQVVRDKDNLEDLKSPVNDLQMVDLMLRSLPTQTCYNELRRKMFFSSGMSKYTPDMVREMILTAESRNKDWENSAFGNSQNKKKPAHATGAQKGGKTQTLSDESRKKTPSADFNCHHCGATKAGTPEPAADEADRSLKRKVVVGEAVKWAAKSYDPSQWYFDTGANAHIVASKEYFTVLQSMEDSDWNRQSLDSRMESVPRLKASGQFCWLL